MATSERVAKFRLGQVVRHRMFPFRGVIFDVDPSSAIPRSGTRRSRGDPPRKDQPFYHLLAENEDAYYVAYVSEQNLVVDDPAIRSSIRRSAKCSRAQGRHVRRAQDRPHALSSAA